MVFAFVACVCVWRQRGRGEEALRSDSGITHGMVCKTSVYFSRLTFAQILHAVHGRLLRTINGRFSLSHPSVSLSRATQPGAPKVTRDESKTRRYIHTSHTRAASPTRPAAGRHSNVSPPCVKASPPILSKDRKPSSTGLL